MKIILIIILCLMTSNYVTAGRSFTDEDLQKYKRKGDKESTGPPSYIEEESPEDNILKKLDNAADEYDQNYWCIWGNYHRNQIKKTKERFKKADSKMREFSSIRLGSIYYQLALDEYEYAKEDLDDAEKDYFQFQDRAYRQDVPASWYRCQYE